MATVSFAKKPTTQTTTPAPETHAVATVPKQEVAAPAYTSQLQGEVSNRDFLVPYLALGQKVGKLTDEHPEFVGKFVYDKAINLGEKIKIVVLNMTKRYEEDLEFGSDEIPRRYDKIEDARADGAEVREIADVDMLIECEQDMGELGGVELLDKSYLPARYTARSTSYTTLYRTVLTDAARGWLKGDFSSGYYEVSPEKRNGKKGIYYVPKLKAAGKVSPELRAAIAEKFQG